MPKIIVIDPGHGGRDVKALVRQSVGAKYDLGRFISRAA